MKGIGDLTDALFAQIERLENAGDNLESEIAKATAITSVSKLVIESSALQLNAVKLCAEHVGMTSTHDVERLLGREVQSVPISAKKRLA